MTDLIDLTGKTAIVTGGARGIGRAIAQKLQAAGANLVIFDIPGGAAEQTASELRSGGRVEVALGDVRHEEEIAAAVKLAADTFGSLDILVNNAGITKDTLAFKMDEGMWDDVLDINLKGAFLFSKAALRVMSKQRAGRIVNLSSVVGLMGNAGQANYAASKAGLVGLTKSLAKEFAAREICINAVAPGFIQSDMTDRLSEKVREEYMKSIPLGRFGTVDDVANVVLFLCSPLASYVTGQVLQIDGGLLM